MNQEQQQIAIALALDKIRQLENFIQSLRTEGSVRRQLRKRRDITPLAQALYDILSISESSMSPKNLHKAVSTTIECTAGQIRTTLHSYRGSLFESPSYGNWRPGITRSPRTG